ncbi:MAG: QueT transporter family protein [Clostridia bacterium]|nr:QueT transporter family protein [Clostridia bacterium]
MKKNNPAREIAAGGIIAAIYVVLTVVSAMFGLASGVIQVRISEALCVLPLFTVSAVPGLAIGCFIANLVSGGVFLDAVFGSLATLIGALITYFIGKAVKGKSLRYVLAPLPNVAANTIIIPWVLRLVYGESGAIWYFALTVGIGEIIGSYVLGLPLMALLEKHKKQIFK